MPKKTELPELPELPQKKDSSEEESKLMVVSQLPSQQLREGTIEGNKYEFITIEEALTELLIKVRKIEKAVA